MIQEKLKDSVSIDSSTDCWNWNKGKNEDGYGYVWHDNRAQRASRVAYEAFVGPITDGLLVLHHCDNAACINPVHLFLGTHQDNADDRNSKQRQAKGEQHPNAKLTQEQVANYRQLRQAASFFIGKRQATRLAREISGIPKTTADHIDSGRRWA